MPHTLIEGTLQGAGLRIAIAVARFNSFVTERLLEGALGGLRRHGVAEDAVTVVPVPGSWELPLTATVLVESKRYDAVICLGAVIRGDTPHFDYVAAEAAKGIASAGLRAAVPVVFGVLTTGTLEQAVDRAGGKAGNKGYDAAVTAIEMATLLQRIRGN
jgi:6,7-dimethyl-8-ribityllumazine synthase